MISSFQISAAVGRRLYSTRCDLPIGNWKFIGIRDVKKGIQCNCGLTSSKIVRVYDLKEKTAIGICQNLAKRANNLTPELEQFQTRIINSLFDLRDNNHTSLPPATIIWAKNRGYIEEEDGETYLNHITVQFPKPLTTKVERTAEWVNYLIRTHFCTWTYENLNELHFDPIFNIAGINALTWAYRNERVNLDDCIKYLQICNKLRLNREEFQFRKKTNMKIINLKSEY